MNDFFLSHAREDKVLIRKVKDALEKKGHKCWLDEMEILPGDSIIGKVFKEGLETSKFVIVFLSKFFLSKNWPKIELETIIARQIRERKNRIIPFVIDISHEKLVEEYPFFESIYYGNARDNFDLMITQLDDLIKREYYRIEDNYLSTNIPETNTFVEHQESDKFDFSKAIKLDALKEISRLRETFYVNYHRAPNDFHIDVVEFSAGFYIAICSYSFWGPHQATPYKSLHSFPTIIEALNDAIKGIDSFDSADFPNDLIFWVSDNNEIYDGNGLALTKDEAYQRRAMNLKEYKIIHWSNVLINGGPWWLISKNFTTKEFSVIGPIDDDSEYMRKCSQIQLRGFDFRIETVPISADSKINLETFFREHYKLKLVTNEELYNKDNMSSE